MKWVEISRYESPRMIGYPPNGAMYMGNNMRLVFSSRSVREVSNAPVTVIVEQNVDGDYNPIKPSE